MSSTHLSPCYHLIFGTHGRLRCIDKSWQKRLGHCDNRPPHRGLFDVNSAFPGLRAALRRFTPGYGSIGASGASLLGYGSICAYGASRRAMAPSARAALHAGLWLHLRLRRFTPGCCSICASGAAKQYISSRSGSGAPFAQILSGSMCDFRSIFEAGFEEAI